MKTILLILMGLSSILSAEFTRDVSGIVTDSSTGLQWQDDAIGTTITWQGAIDRCEALSLGGHEDWRLPNLRELTALIDDTKHGPSINDVFVSTASEDYYSSTTDAINSDDLWYVNFNIGYQGTSYKNGYGYVRCVRAESNWSFVI